MREESQSFTARLPLSVYDALCMFAYYTDRTKSAVLAEAVKQYVLSYSEEDFMELVEEAQARVLAQQAKLREG